MPPVVRFAIAFLLLVLLVGGGTLGYTLIEGWSVGDSLYMTVITITTVGFSEVRPLTTVGRQFTILLLIFSVVTVGYSVTTVIGFIFEGQILKAMRGRRMERTVSKLRDHYIICGYGVVGREVALEFKNAGVPFVTIEQDAERCELARDESVLVVVGNAENDETLMEAGIDRATGLVSVLRNDEANVFVVLTARQLNSGLTIVSRAAEERTTGKLLKAGADRVISPYQIAGRRIASVILRPSVMNFLDVVVEGGDVAMRLEEVLVKEGSPLIGKRLRETGIGQQTGAIIVGIQGPDERGRINPAGHAVLSSVVLSAGDQLIALGSEEQLARLEGLARSDA
jgi:voltage-gated potassium channel